MIQETSKQAYNDIIPKIGSRQKLVYEEIVRQDGATNTEISQAIGLPINAITPRTNELVKMGYVQEGGKRKCKVTGRTCIYWEVIKSTLF